MVVLPSRVALGQLIVCMSTNMYIRNARGLESCQNLKLTNISQIFRHWIRFCKFYCAFFIYLLIYINSVANFDSFSLTGSLKLACWEFTMFCLFLQIQYFTTVACWIYIWAFSKKRDFVNQMGNHGWNIFTLSILVFIVAISQHLVSACIFSFPLQWSETIIVIKEEFFNNIK